MLRKILIALFSLIIVLLAVGAFIYFRYLKPAPPPISASDRTTTTLLPLPAQLKFSGDTFLIKEHLDINIEASPADPIIANALQRWMLGLPENIQRKMLIDKASAFTIHYDTASAPLGRPFENEAYKLVVTASGISLKAPRAIGILRGLETLRQLVTVRNGMTSIPTVEIIDKPRYSWRGLMLDAGRHWLSKSTVLRTLEVMSALKINVLHWHLSEYQAFRAESKLFPNLHAKGSDGNFYSQADMKEVVQFAHERGIRVIPEFDMPGHTTSWFAGYPELASSPGPYKPETKFGVLPPVMDPSREEVYSFLDQFVGEMSAIFPDPYFHIGGDEVMPDQWNNNKSIQEFMKKGDMNNPSDLQAYFNSRLQQILLKHGKKMVGWDEILRGKLDSGVVIQSWHGQKPLFAAARAGHESILSGGWYLDHKLPAGKYYQVDPAVLPGAITIKPDSLRWEEYDIVIKVSDNPIKGSMILYGDGPSRTGLFQLMDNTTGFENAEMDGEHIKLAFASDFGSIDFEGDLPADSLSGKMSLGILSFPVEGKRVGGNDMKGTHPPKVEQVKPLSDVESKRILGGEAALWTEVISERNVDTRLWPRTAAIAEKLWSPQSLTKDVDDMYRRLEVVAIYLRKRGAEDEKEYTSMITDLASGKDPAPLRIFMDAVEEVKYYDRLAVDKNLSTLSPLNEVVDAALPESLSARRFNMLVSQFFKNPPGRKSIQPEIERYLSDWLDLRLKFQALSADNPRLKKIDATVTLLEELGNAGWIGLRVNTGVQKVLPEDKAKLMELIEKAGHPDNGIMIAILPGVKQLVENIH